MSNIYNGNSDSFDFLVDCYMDYGQEVICRRALPDVRDGQKKVNRRIIYSAYINKKPTKQKCIPFVADAVKLHPHGDQAVYGAFTLMTDENGSYNMPLFEGLGNLGKVYSSKKPADMRYPKAKVNENLEQFFFREKDVMHLVPAEEGEGSEPEVLNAIFPIVLVNGTMGIAVSVGTKIPSFNFGDVLDLTIRYLVNGKLEVSDCIVPDFPTGGILVKNDAEIAKIMTTGRGKLKIRAKVEIDGNQILVKEVPYGKTVEGIKALIDGSGIREIQYCTITVGREAPALMVVKCRSKKVVDYVLKELYRRNILQDVFASNIVVTEKEVPYILGVHKIIEKWSTWRIGVLKEKFEKLLASISDEVETLDYFIRLVSNPEWKHEYTQRALYGTKAEASEYLHTIFEDILEGTCDWIWGRSISAFNNGGRYIKRLEELRESEKFYKDSLNNPKQYIINELEELKSFKAGQYERKTQVTYTDYKFSKVYNADEIEDESYCVWSLRKDGFLMKTRDFQKDNFAEGEILTECEGQANSILIGFDNFGRILRVIGKEIPFTGNGENGVYLPKYFDATFQEDYRVLYMGLLDGSKRMLVYRDGYIGFFNTAEYYGKKNTKCISNGVCLAVYDKLLEVYEEKDIPQQLLLANEVNDEVYLGIVNIEGLPERSRLSRTKIFPGTINTPYLKEFNGMEVYNFIEKPEEYFGKVKKFKHSFYGDPTEVRDGMYLDICKDYNTEG